jgi:predicted nucleic acid-binding protein
MKYFFDTSALVPAFSDDHVHHEPSLAALRKASLKDSCCAAHTLAELFSTMTRMPDPHRASPEEAMLLLETVVERLSLVALDTAEYWSTLKQCSDTGIIGGAVYDALIARCAVKSGAQVLYTWNVADFQRLGPEISKKVQTP